MITNRPDENILSQMFIAYVSNNKVEPSEVEDVVRAIVAHCLRRAVQSS